MIRDLSMTLQAILSDASLAVPFPELHNALIAFDRPDDGFKPAQTTVDLFLFDVREMWNCAATSEDRPAERTGRDPIALPCAWHAPT